MDVCDASLGHRRRGGSKKSDAFGRVRAAIQRLQRGGMVVLLGPNGTEKPAMAMLAASHATAERLHRLTRLTTGSIYLAMPAERCDALGLRAIAAEDGSVPYAPMTMPIIASSGVDSGFSYHDRAHTIANAIDAAKGRNAIRTGGNVFAIRARSGGVIERAGFSEAAVDLVRSALLTPAAVLSEVLDHDGSAMRGGALKEFGSSNDMPAVGIADVVEFRMTSERLIDRAASTTIVTSTGEYLAIGYKGILDRAEHLALVRGELGCDDEELAYVHHACWEGDVFQSTACPCRSRLDAARRAIDRKGSGILVHLAHAGHYHHQQPDHTERILSLRIAAHIISDLGTGRVRMLTDDGYEVAVFEEQGITVVGVEPLTNSQ